MKIEGNFFNDSFKINDFKISFTFNHSFIIHSLFLNNQFVVLRTQILFFLLIIELKFYYINKMFF